MKTFDAVIVAKGAPVRTSDGKTTMCAIAVSAELGLVRLYPLTVTENSDVRLWRTVRVTARRSDKDNRRESWRVESCEAIGWQAERSRFELLDSLVLRSGKTDPIAYQNECKASIAVVKVTGAMGAGLVARSDSEKQTIDAEDSWVMTQDQYPFKPYLFWNSLQGGEHKTHLLAQEVYVGLQKFAATPFRVFENMGIADPDFEHWMVLGNMKDRRNVWVCCMLHRLKKRAATTHLSFGTCDGSDGAWPYLQQEAINAKDAGPQRVFAFTTSDTK